MNIKTWRSRMNPEYQGIATMASRFMQAEIDELRAALQERDAEKADMQSAVRWAPSSAYWSQELVKFFGPDARDGINALEGQLRDAQETITAQRKVLEQALKALEKSVNTCFDRYSYDQVRGEPSHFVNKAITAIQGVLK